MDLISKKDLEQQQKAGDNSTQIMVSGNVNVGVTEQQARDILEDKVLPKMLSYDENLSIFGDPGFQILLRKAQIAAASSEREDYYEILSDLLLHRAEQDKNRERRLGIAKAIEVVDQIDEVALIALSIVYAVSKYTPISPRLNEGLEALDILYDKILNKKSLPTNSSWMEHLDLLSAIRLT